MIAIKVLPYVTPWLHKLQGLRLKSKVAFHKERYHVLPVEKDTPPPMKQVPTQTSQNLMELQM